MFNSVLWKEFCVSAGAKGQEVMVWNAISRTLSDLVGYLVFQAWLAVFLNGLLPDLQL